MALEPWKRIEPTEVTKAGYRTITEKHFQIPNGPIVDRTIVNEDNWQAACAIVITTDNKVVLARQFRPGPEKFFDEIPGGIVDASETPEAAILRELSEEVGYQAGNIEYLGVYHYDAYVNGRRHYFLLTDCTPTESGPHPEPDEQIEILQVSINDLLDNAKHGKMTDPGAVLLAYDRLCELRANS